MAVAEADDLLPGKTDFSRATVNEDKVVARAVHLGEFQNHARGTYILQGQIAMYDAR
jgi:hypothetical protein